MSPFCTQIWGHIALPLSAQSVSVCVCLPFISLHCFLSCRWSNTRRWPNVELDLKSAACSIMWAQPYERQDHRKSQGVSVALLAGSSSLTRRSDSGAYGFISSERYAGANPWMDLYTRRRIFKMIRDLTGNQWRDLMTGVMWSCFLVCVMSRAALCWRSCRQWMSLSGKPKSNELQLSSLEVTKEWTSCSVARGVRNLTIFPIMWIWMTTWLTQCADLLLHTEMRVKYYTQIFYIGACRDCWKTQQGVRSIIIDYLGVFWGKIDKGFKPSWCIKASFRISEEWLNFLRPMDFKTNVFIELFK